MAAKYIDFEAVEQLASIEQLATMLGLELKRSGSALRCECPVHGGDHRTLCVSPQVRSRKGSEGVFYCQQDKTGGDRIGLVAHCMELGQQDAAFFIAQQFGMEIANSRGTSTTVTTSQPHVPPAREKAATSRETTRPEFDPLAFLAKLTYSDEVKATGLSEEDAKSLGVGFYRGKLYQAARWPNGNIACFTTPDGASLKFPAKLVQPKEAKILRLEKRA